MQKTGKRKSVTLLGAAFRWKSLTAGIGWWIFFRHKMPTYFKWCLVSVCVCVWICSLHALVHLSAFFPAHETRYFTANDCCCRRCWLLTASACGEIRNVCVFSRIHTHFKKVKRLFFSPNYAVMCVLWPLCMRPLCIIYTRLLAIER